mmetsp:Transcript_1378/g.2598  ORF Transcript_1378/g.2598 Transcript_1378/m.2598 type:complete len:100 (+) Transcript_1378:489-788(+)
MHALLLVQDTEDDDESDLKVHLQSKLTKHDEENTAKTTPGELVEFLQRSQLPALTHWFQAIDGVEHVALFEVNDLSYPLDWIRKRRRAYVAESGGNSQV